MPKKSAHLPNSCLCCNTKGALKITIFASTKDSKPLEELSIGFVLTHPFHGSPGSVLRVRELSKSLSNFGVTVHVYSPYTANEFWGKNVHFHKLPSFASAFGLDTVTYNLARKVLNNRFIARYSLSPWIIDRMIRNLAESLTDAVTEVDVLQGEQEIAAAACVKAKQKLGIPIVTSLHNIWPEELVAMGLINKASKEYDSLHRLEHWIVTGSDLVVTVSDAMTQYLKNRYNLSDVQIAMIPPGGRAKVNNVYKGSFSCKVVYAGLVVPRAQIDLFIKSMPFVLEKYPEAEFYITRKGEQIRQMKKLAHKVGVHPEFYWFHKNEDFYKFLASCNLGVVTSSDDLPRRLGPAVKLFDYLSVGLPVVANDIGGWTKLIETEQIGVLAGSDPKSFADAIIRLLDDQRLAQRYSEQGLSLVKTKLNWDTSARLLMKQYECMLS